MTTRTRAFLCVVVVTTALLLVPVLSGASGFQGGSDRASIGVSEPLVANAADSGPWNTSTDGWVASSPAVANGTVYVGTWNGSVYALDGTTGTVEWRYRTGGAVESDPSVVDGTVYVGSNDDTLYALDAATGDVRWTFAAGDDIEGGPAIRDGTVYVGSLDGNVYALDAGNGDELWRFEADGEVRSRPAVADGTVYVGSNDGSVYALDATTGAEQWNLSTGGWVTSSPAVAGGTVYVGSTTGSVYALDATTGGVQWNVTVGGAVESSPAVANGTVFVGSYDRSLHALDGATGEPRWNVSTGGVIKSSPTVANGTVFFGSQDGNVYAVGMDSGAEHWSVSTNGWVLSSPVVANSAVYVGSFDTRVYALPVASNTSDATTPTPTPTSTATPTPTPTPTPTSTSTATPTPTPTPTPTGTTTPTPTPTATPTPTPTPTGQAPYGDGNDVPGTIQAENYDVGGESVAYHDSDETNHGGAYRTDGVDIQTTDGGGYNVGWIEDGEWLEYTTDVRADTYDLIVRMASPSTDTHRLRVLIDDTLIGTIDIPTTGGWQDWQTVTLSDASLSSGSERVLRLEVVGGDYNIDWIAFDSTATEHTLEVEGTGEPTPYEFGVDGEITDGDQLQPNDEYNETTAAGTVSTWSDLYTFTGNLSTLIVDGNASVYLDGERIDPAAYDGNVLRIEGNGTRTPYEFTVDREITNGDQLQSSDEFNETTATGHVSTGTDEYTFVGNLSTLVIEGDATVYLNGERIDPTNYDGRIIRIEGSGPVSPYEFGVDGEITDGDQLQSSDEYNATTAAGYVSTGTDEYTFTGSLSTLTLDGNATVYIDYERVDDEDY